MAKARVSNWDHFGTPVPGDVYRCLEEMGVEIIREVQGEVLGRCPMHFARTGKEDAHPSWSVNVDSGVFNCFSCGYKGPFVLLVQDVLDVDRAEAVAWVRERGGIERVRKMFREDKGLKVIDTTEQINEASLALFIDPPQWALDDRDLLLESVHLYGVSWDDRNERWILPIRDPDTDVLMGWQEKGKDWFKNFPYGVPKSNTLFGSRAFGDADFAIVVESPLDALRIHTAGFDGAVSTYGAAVSHKQIQILKGLTDEIVFALDNPWIDKAGKKSMESLAQSLRGSGLRVRFFDYAGSDAKDPGEMEDDEIAWGIEHAIPLHLVGVTLAN
jgi:DNA primase